MRIAQITYSYQPITGGADVWVETLRRVCEQAGHQVVVYQRPTQPLTDPAVRPIPSVWRALLGTRAEFWTLPSGLHRLRRELESCDVLVAHYPNFHLPVQWHPRTVLVSHGVFWDDRPRALRSRIKRRLARLAYRRAARVVANDTFFLREMGEAAPVGTPPFSSVAPGRFFVPNCVDPEQFRPSAPHPALPEPPIVLVPRNLYWNRGVHLAIQAFARCAESLDGARLVIVGGVGQPDYAGHCVRLVEELGLADRVLFAGPVEWQLMPSVYSAAQLTVIPTLCGEGTSLAALESMSCGTATVTTNVAGLADLPAMQCDPAPEALAAAMMEGWHDRQRLAQQQMATVRQVYNLENWRKAWLEILEGLVQGNL